MKDRLHLICPFMFSKMVMSSYAPRHHVINRAKLVRKLWRVKTSFANMLHSLVTHGFRALYFSTPAQCSETCCCCCCQKASTTEEPCSVVHGQMKHPYHLAYGWDQQSTTSVCTDDACGPLLTTDSADGHDRRSTQRLARDHEVGAETRRQGKSRPHHTWVQR